MNRDSKAKHTAAPWSIEPGENKGAWIGHKNAWAALACGNTDEEAAANARLIAEAPTMLALLQRIVDLEPILLYPNNTHVEHQGEAQAVSEMLSSVKELIKKIEQ